MRVPLCVRAQEAVTGLQSEVQAKERTIRELQAQVNALSESVAAHQHTVVQLEARNAELASARAASDKAGKEERREHLAQMNAVKQQLVELERRARHTPHTQSSYRR
jgi:predicted  nucleic acid-binding Zn-ribbon protein